MNHLNEFGVDSIKITKKNDNNFKLETTELYSL